MNQDADSRPEVSELAIARYVDGELAEPEARKFERRLAADADLAEKLRQARELRGLFAAGRAELGPEPGAEFKTRVMRDIARLPSYSEWHEDVATDLGIWGKRIVAAAIIIIGLSALIYSGVIGPADSGRLEASSAEIKERIKILDAQINASGDGQAVLDGSRREGRGR